MATNRKNALHVHPAHETTQTKEHGSSASPQAAFQAWMNDPAISLHPVLNTSPFDFNLVLAMLEAGADVNTRDLDGNTLLHRLSELNEDGRYDALIEKLVTQFHADVNLENQYGFTPLQCMTNNRRPNYACAIQLVRWGADPVKYKKDKSIVRLLAKYIEHTQANTKNNTNIGQDDITKGLVILSFLEQAIKYDHVDDALKMAVKNSAYVRKAIKKHSFEFLSKAIYLERKKEIISFLIRNGADVNATRDKSKVNVLQYALSNNSSTSTVRLLLNHGADPDSVADWNYLSIENEELIKEYQRIKKSRSANKKRSQKPSTRTQASHEIKETVKSNRYTFAALEKAVFSNKLGLVQILLENGAGEDTDATEKEDSPLDSLLHFALLNSSSSMVRLLLNHGADPDSDTVRKLPLRFLSAEKRLILEQHRQTKYEHYIQNLPEKHNVDLLNEHDATVLLRCIMDNPQFNLEHAMKLLRLGADPITMKNEKGETVIHILATYIASNQASTKASENTEDDITKGVMALSLLEKTIEKKQVSDKLKEAIKNSAYAHAAIKKHAFEFLRKAVSHNNLEIVRLLLAHGADINATQGNSSFNVLQFALLNNHPSMARMLLDLGANPDSVENLTSLSAEKQRLVQQYRQLKQDVQSDKYPSQSNGITNHRLLTLLERLSSSSLLRLRPIRKEEINAIKSLIKAGASLQAAQAGSTPLQLALKSRHWEKIVTAILEAASESGKQGEVSRDDILLVFHKAQKKRAQHIIDTLSKDVIFNSIVKPKVIDQPLSKNTLKACPVTLSNGVGCEADLNEKRREKAQHTHKYVSIFPFIFHSKASADGVSRTEPELLQPKPATDTRPDVPPQQETLPVYSTLKPEYIPFQVSKAASQSSNAAQMKFFKDVSTPVKEQLPPVKPAALVANKAASSVEEKKGNTNMFSKAWVKLWANFKEPPVPELPKGPIHDPYAQLEGLPAPTTTGSQPAEKLEPVYIHPVNPSLKT